MLLATGFEELELLGLAFVVVFREPPATLSDATWTEEPSPPAQSIHQTSFDDGDQWARSPVSSLVAHDRQRPAYFSEMKRRPLGSSILGPQRAPAALARRSEHVRISVETRGSPVDLVYAALDREAALSGRSSFSALSNFGKSLYPLTRRDNAWSTASRLPRSRTSFGVHTYVPLSCVATRSMILSAMRVIASFPRYARGKGISSSDVGESPMDHASSPVRICRYS